MADKLFVTDKAINQIIKLKKEKGKPILRISVLAGGCSGLMYKMSLDDVMDLREDDYLVKSDSFPVVTNKKMMPFLEGVTLDFDDDLNGSGFNFSNPNAEGTCGCGNSFKAK